jgi:hypothetical protein
MKRKEVLMPIATDLTMQEWFLKNAGILIHCPYQPGDLKITPNVCRQRHRLSKGMVIEDGELSITKRGFAVCRRCPIGRNLAAAN